MTWRGQNRSTAVMQRRTEPRDSLEDFPTPPWATRALCEHLARHRDLRSLTVREPAANRGYMARPLTEYFGRVEASDVHDFGVGYPVRDFLFPEPMVRLDWTITNPPFRLAEQFVERARQTSVHGVAMIVRSAFLEGKGRHARLFSRWRPSRVLQFVERVVMHRGRVTADGTTATAYAWLIWDDVLRSTAQTRFEWIAPCRQRLERPGDYDPWPQEVVA
jgi:predicted RNA methylase